MDKNTFKQDTRYTITWRSPEDKLRPANIYVFRLYETCMIARMTEKAGLLYKIPYSDIIKIVKETAVDKENQFMIPAAILDEKVWKDRTVMDRYSSSPHMGK